MASATGPTAAPAPTVVPRELARLTVLGALVGVPAGLVAFGFVSLVHLLEQLLWTTLPERLGSDGPPWWLVLALPTLAGVLVHLARRLPGDGGHAPIQGLAGGTPRPRDAAGVALAALATLPFGVVLGPEAPLTALGTVVGVWVTSWARLPGKGPAVLGVAGAGAAMSTLFGGPLVAGLMLLEGGVGAGALVVPLLVPALVASAVAYVLVTGLGGWTGLPVAGMALPGLPEYESVLVRDLLAALVVGVVAALLARAVRRAATALHGMDAPTGRLPLLVAGGLVVGACALVAQALGADPQDVLFSGQASIPAVVGASTAGAVLVLLVAKAVAFAVSLGAGFRGGPIFPAVFLGVALASFGVVGFGMSPTAAVAVGTAAGMTAMTRMVLAPLMFAALLTGRQGLDALPLAVVATALAWLTSAAVDHRLEARRQGAAAHDASATARAGAALPAHGSRGAADERG